MNIGLSFLFFFWIIAPILYCACCDLIAHADADDTTPVTNSKSFAFFPISSTQIFDNTGAPYQPSNIITNGIFDQAKYEAYSPVFLPVTRALAVGITLSSFPAMVVHTYCELNT